MVGLMDIVLIARQCVFVFVCVESIFYFMNFIYKALERRLFVAVSLLLVFT
jgi:hypothetical protein